MTSASTRTEPAGSLTDFGRAVLIRLADLGEHCHRAQRRWRDAASDVAEHRGLAVVEAENRCGVDARVDAPDDHHVPVRVEPQVGVEVAGREYCVAFSQIIDV